MLTVDGAFDRIGFALRDKGYELVADERTPDDSGDRSAIFSSSNMAVRVSWNARARILSLQIDADGGWVDFSRQMFGPKGLEDSTVDALVRKVGNEVGETSTDSD